MTRGRRIVVFAGLLSLAGLSMSQSPAVRPTQRPTTRVADCTTSGCHAAEVNFPMQHGPVAAGACDVCHSYVDVEKHHFELKRTGAALCDFCHIGKTDVAGVHVHKPVADGQCLSCHQPHGSTQRNLMRGATEAQTCLTCHGDVASKSHVHTPLTQGTCTDCHKAHTSLFDHLLVAEGRSLCMKCHADVGTPMHAKPAPAVFTAAQLKDPGEALPVHKPVLDDCAQCHNPHSSDHAALLTQPPLKLCTSCHADIAQKASSATVAHAVVTDDRACLNCHTAHSSPVHSLLRDWPGKLCMSCHDKAVVRADGTTVPAATDLIEPHRFIHKPLTDDTCSACHDVHGGAHRDLLTHEYTDRFYETYAPEKYELCLSCHDQHMLTDANTTTATGFRNGDVNLHYLHVVAQGDKGRTCRACHATHTADNASRLKQETPFGEWNIPIDYQSSATGGSCAAGCHRPRQYDREKPVKYEIPAVVPVPQDKARENGTGS